MFKTIYTRKKKTVELILWVHRLDLLLIKTIVNSHVMKIAAVPIVIVNSYFIIINVNIFLLHSVGFNKYNTAVIFREHFHSKKNRHRLPQMQNPVSCQFQYIVLTDTAFLFLICKTKPCLYLLQYTLYFQIPQETKTACKDTSGKMQSLCVKGCHSKKGYWGIYKFLLISVLKHYH